MKVECRRRLFRLSVNFIESAAAAGQMNREGAAFVNSAMDGYEAPVNLGDVLDNGQPQPCPPELSASAFIYHIKPLENACQVLFFNAAALVANRNKNFRGVLLNRDCYRTVIRAVLYGIINQIEHRLLNQGRIYFGSDSLLTAQLYRNIFLIGFVF